MSDERHIRLVSILQELAATFVRNEANTDPLITITNVHVTPDNKNVTIFFTTIPEEKEGDALIFLKRSGKEFRAFLKQHARLKIIPNIEFAVDFGERHRQHIDELVHDIEKEKED